MKVLAINGSPNNSGNTKFALNVIGDEIKNCDIEFEILDIGLELFKGCTACGHCMNHKTGECVIKNDNVNFYLSKIIEADALILGSPTYFGGMTGPLKSFLDRAFLVATIGSEEPKLAQKIAAGISTVRRGGGVDVINSFNHYFQEAGMIIPGSTYWNIIFGTYPGDCKKDEEGIQTLRVLGKNIVYLLKMKQGSDFILPPKSEKKILTDFIK